MDLDRLKIDRSADRHRRGSGLNGRGDLFTLWLRRAVALAVAGLLVWLFHVPARSWIDRWRLPEVEAFRVVKRSAAALAAVEGAAANGYIVARTRAALSADTPGKIVELNVQEGQAIEEGFVVARLYDEEYAASLRRAEADLTVGRAALKRGEAALDAASAELSRLETAKKAAAAFSKEAAAEEKLSALNYERVERLVADGIDTRQRLDEARASLDVAAARAATARANLDGARASVTRGRSDVALASAAVDEARAQLDVLQAVRDQAAATLRKTEVRAPFAGVVVLKDAEVGEVVSPNSQAGSNARGSIVTMVDFNSLEAQAEVPETTLQAVEVGAPVRIYLDAFPDRPYRGRVDRIWPTANRQKATVEVRAVFDEPDHRLRPEMGVRVVFLSQDDPHRSTAAEGAQADAAGTGAAILLPADAIVRIEGQPAVFVLERDVARLRSVALGERRADRVIVRSGLEENELVVRRPPAALDDGDRVRMKR